MAKRYGFSVTQKGRVSPFRRKGLTLLEASPTWASTTVTGTFYVFPFVDLTICRTLPDSASLPPGLYCSAICPSGQAHYSPNYPPPTTRTSSYTISTHCDSYAAESHLINLKNSHNYINPRNTLVNLNTITKRLYLILQTRLLSSRIHAQLPDSICHRKRPPPV